MALIYTCLVIGCYNHFLETKQTVFFNVAEKRGNGFARRVHCGHRLCSYTRLLFGSSCVATNDVWERLGDVVTVRAVGLCLTVAFIESVGSTCVGVGIP